MKGRVLVVDDEKNLGLVIQAMLEKAGLEVLVFDSPQGVLELLENEELDVIVTDLHMPDISGFDILEFCRKTCPQIPVVVITAFATVESAVQTLKQGAFDFITKPFDQSEFLMVIQKALATYHQRQKEPLVLFPHSTSSVESAICPSSSMIGSSVQMKDLFKVISKIADSPSTVMLTGESGTGKELVAYEIHQLSRRKQKPLIKINCAAIPANLIESELFGFERGAFTGAVASKPGRFELAHEGTLFLDEVAEMPLEMQVKLLRALQEQEFERVGGVRTIKVDVRIIAATNRELDLEVKNGNFREDLFYRLNVVPIRLPPLRERSEDIEALSYYFLKEFNQKLGKSLQGLTPQILEAFRRYEWPGNIRQLENVLERMMLMSETTVLDVSDLPEEMRHLGEPSLETNQDDPASMKEIIRRKTRLIEKELISSALLANGGNVTKSAEKLGLSRKGLQLKMKELGIKR